MKKQYKLMSLALTGALLLFLLAGCANTTAPSASANTETSKPPTTQTANSDALIIAEQGMFSAGGITTTSDGTFTPEDQWE